MDFTDREEGVDDGGPRNCISVGHFVEQFKSCLEITTDNRGFDNGVPGDEVFGVGGYLMEEVKCFGEFVVLSVSEDENGVERRVRGRDFV